jgi:hypothetical protein
LAALERLRSESSVFVFKTAHGNPPQHYTLGFRGASLSRDRGKIVVREYHEVDIRLGTQYPRTMPELRWLTPIYHPNISEIGMVCLGAYGTHWVPSLALDELCVMLWDMARYQNYDIRSPYNREAALWAANQSSFRFPMDGRTLRDLREKLGRFETTGATSPQADASAAPPEGEAPRSDPASSEPRPRRADRDGVVILDLELDLRKHDPSPVPTRPAPPPPPQEDVIFID